MASRFQRGWLRRENRKTGTVWKLRYYAVRAEDGNRVERTLFVGSIKDFPKESDAWREVDRQRLTEKINDPTLRGEKLTFRQIAMHYIDNDLSNPDVIKPKASTTKDCYKHVIHGFLINRWGNEAAIEISPSDVERWLKTISVDRSPDGLEWPTLSKMRNVMSLVYAHAQRQGLIPADLKYNPVRPSELGGARCKSESDYTAVILTPEQTFQILNSLPLLQQTMVILDAATGLRYSEIAGLKWLDVDWGNNQIHVRRRWIRGNVSEPKSNKSKAPVAMAPLLAKYLRAWQLETPYAKATDWVFSSEKTRGRTPRVGNMLCVDYLRPAALKAGVKLEAGQRFGFHNLRHSLASFLVTKKKTDVKTAQRSLRHSKSTTMLDHYAQTDMDELIAAQELMLDAIFSHAEGPVQ
ncbi:MAG: site-specific integrase [Candidatus Sulfotelmatobacter sp.]|jgi:integrase